MKSIANQYRDLQEGRMSQFNFMRNLRMSMPQVTNTTSFSDAVKILKNKGILSETVIKESEVLSQAAQDEGKMSRAEEIADLKAEIQALMNSGSQQDPEIVSDKIDDIRAKIEKLKAEKSESLNEAVNDSGKQEYSKFSEAENDNLNELTDGITIEHECFPTKTYDEIVKIVTKNLKKDPFYYTMYKLTGTRDSKMQTLDKTNTPEVMAMKYVTNDNLVDKGRGTKVVKTVAAVKADKAKATKAKAKNIKVDVFSLVAKSQRGIPKMKPLGEKMKNVVMKEATMPFKDLPADPEKYKMVKDSKGYIIKATNADGVEFQKGDTVKTYDGETIKIVKFEESQGKVKAIYNKGMFFAGIDIDGLEAPKPTIRPGVDMGKSFEKFKSKLAEMVRKAMDEMYDGRDNLDAEI
jgi:hypothetical protein